MEKIREHIALCEKHRNAYFWRPGSSASQRRRNEFSIRYTYLFSGPNGEPMSAELSAKRTESCKNVYFWSSAVVNGINCNIADLKRLVAWLEGGKATAKIKQIIAAAKPKEKDNEQ